MAKQAEILDIPFPETADLERQIIADVIVSPEMMGDVLPLIHEDFFTKTTRRDIWNTIVSQFNKGQSFDMVTIANETGHAFVEEIIPCINVAGGTINCLSHAALLRTGAARRRAYFAATTFLTGAVAPHSTEADILSSIEAFSATVEGPAPLQTETRLGDALKETRKDLEETKRREQKGETLRISSGFHYLDEALGGGWKPGQLVILAARPSVGKTSVMLHIAKQAAKTGNPAYIVSMEMTVPELAEKFVLSTGKVRPWEITHGPQDFTLFDEAAGELSPLPVLINDYSRTLDEVVARLTQAVKQGRCKIAFIDYLGLFQDCFAFAGNVKLYQVISRITGTLKAVAKRLGIPIVLLCQLNREQAREKRAPELFDLRDSGSIEQDADIVIMLEPKPEEGRLIAWLRKNRGGRKVTKDGAGLGYILVPNDTYSAFEEGLPVGELNTPTDSAVQTSMDLHHEPVEEQQDLPF